PSGGLALTPVVAPLPLPTPQASVVAIPPLPAAAALNFHPTARPPSPSAPVSAAALPTPEGQRPVLRDLEELSRHLQRGRGERAVHAYDGSRIDMAAAFVPAALERASLPEMATVAREIQEPSRLLRAHGIRATVTVYGSARILSPAAAKAELEAVAAETGKSPQDAAGKRRLKEARKNLAVSRYYRVARELGALVAKEGRGKVAVVSGGGPGIMEAANRGAFEAGGPSVAYNIKLPHEQKRNPYATRELEFSFENFSTRKMSLRHGAMGLVYFPGGFGTMDELFEVLTLIQTGKMARVPIVLVGEKSYWAKVLDFDEFARMGLIAQNDLSLFTFAETADQAWKEIVLGQIPAARP
ncbi:MAG: TIGR00730 family Rossman fold protein, partial [Elusimicrobiota bacterium]